MMMAATPYRSASARSRMSFKRHDRHDPNLRAGAAARHRWNHPPEGWGFPPRHWAGYRRWTCATSSVRLRAPDLRSNELTCFSTVLTEIISRSAIILSGRPFSHPHFQLGQRGGRRSAVRRSVGRCGQQRLAEGRREHRLHERLAVDALVQATVGACAQRGRHQMVVPRLGQTQHRTMPGLDEPAGQLHAVGLAVVTEAKARYDHVGRRASCRRPPEVYAAISPTPMVRPA